MIAALLRVPVRYWLAALLYAFTHRSTNYGNH